MHREVTEWVSRYATVEPIIVLDIGGRDVNGTNRSLFPGAVYTVLDIRDGDGVDIVADAASWTPDREYDLVLSTEVFEHTPDWPQICATAFKALTPGGRFVATMAGPNRPSHSAVDGGWTLHPGEHYGNVWPAHLRSVLQDCGFVDIDVDEQRKPSDVRCVAHKPRGV